MDTNDFKKSTINNAPNQRTPGAVRVHGIGVNPSIRDIDQLDESEHPVDQLDESENAVEISPTELYVTDGDLVKRCHGLLRINQEQMLVITMEI